MLTAQHLLSAPVPAAVAQPPRSVLIRAAVPSVVTVPAMPAHRARSCDRPVCSGTGDASLTYDYAGRRAWLDDLDDEHDPHAYDLCADHADRSHRAARLDVRGPPRRGRDRCSTCRSRTPSGRHEPTSRSDRLAGRRLSP